MGMPPLYVPDSLRERSNYLSMRRNDRFTIIRLATQNTLKRPSKSFMPESGDVKPVQIHYLIPSRNEIVQKLLP
jgi:hypothetical protein